MVESKLAGPACRSPLVSKPRTGKADGTTEISERMIFSLFFFGRFQDPINKPGREDCGEKL